LFTYSAFNLNFSGKKTHLIFGKMNPVTITPFRREQWAVLPSTHPIRCFFTTPLRYQAASFDFPAVDTLNTAVPEPPGRRASPLPPSFQRFSDIRTPSYSFYSIVSLPFGLLRLCRDLSCRAAASHLSIIAKDSVVFRFSMSLAEWDEKPPTKRYVPSWPRTGVPVCGPETLTRAFFSRLPERTVDSA